MIEELQAHVKTLTEENGIFHALRGLDSSVGQDKLYIHGITMMAKFTFNKLIK